MQNTIHILEQLNKEYLDIHRKYEEYYWVSYMWDKSNDTEFQAAKSEWNKFRENREKLKIVKNTLENETNEELKTRLNHWKHFFELYQVPENIVTLREKITALENTIHVKRAEMKTGYVDPKTGLYCQIPENKLSFMIATEEDEELRKACFIWKEEAAKVVLEEYVELVWLRDEYAKNLGYRNFYHYKARIEEQMEETEIFSIFDELYKTLSPFYMTRLEELKKTKLNLCTPWNLAYGISGDFVREEDQYFPLETIIDTWWKSFSALGIDYCSWLIRFDLLERNLKYNNGFCHQPILVNYNNWKRFSWEVNVSCNAIIGQIGSWLSTGATLFHEGWHAAHFFNMNNKDVCINTEYPPMWPAWAETQSMFLESLFSSPEWKVRYAKSLDGKSYPFSLYEEKLRKTYLLAPHSMLSIMSVIEFERQIYSADNLTANTVTKIAQELSIKYNWFNTPSLYLLTVPHIYSWSASCAYHGYALATLALNQWKDYLYNKHGYLIDNPAVWQEMKKVWSFWSSKDFSELVEIATWEKLSPKAYINRIIKWEDYNINQAKERIARMKTVPEFQWEPDLNAEIYLVDWVETITSNKNWFNKMCTDFRRYIEKRK